MEFFGREAELKELNDLWGKRGGSLMTCRGRRRIGKSTLIEEFARRSKARFIKIEGARPKSGYSNVSELRTFADQLTAQALVAGSVPDNWLKAFQRLDGTVNDDERTVVLLDEVSWLGHYTTMSLRSSIKAGLSMESLPRSKTNFASWRRRGASRHDRFWSMTESSRHQWRQRASSMR